jgi:predicted cobalt transporter CbtA
MNTINTKGLMLGMLAIGGLIAGGAMFQGQAYAQLPPLLQINPINAASASNSDDDVVVQANSATVKQESETKCEAKVSDDDKFQVGDNVNAAANDCDTTQTANVGQANVNTDNDVQVAEATSCQALALLIGANVCDNAITVEILDDLPTTTP